MDPTQAQQVNETVLYEMQGGGTTSLETIVFELQSNDDWMTDFVLDFDRPRKWLVSAFLFFLPSRLLAGNAQKLSHGVFSVSS